MIEEYSSNLNSNLTPEENYTQGILLHNKGRYREAFTFFKQAAEGEYFAAYIYLTMPFIYHLKSEETGNFYISKIVQNIDWFKDQTNTGSPDAQFNLGYIYESVLKNYDEALNNYEKAADQGFLLAQFHLGLLYEVGRGTPQDYKKALEYYQMASDQGYPQAQFHLGCLYEIGCGVPEEFKDCTELYEIGYGIPQDYSKAFKYHKLAANLEFPQAQFHLGHLYENGLGIPQDYIKALEYYQMASDQILGAKSAYNLLYSRLQKNERTAENLNLTDQTTYEKCLPVSPKKQSALPDLPNISYFPIKKESEKVITTEPQNKETHENKEPEKAATTEQENKEITDRNKGMQHF